FCPKCGRRVGTPDVQAPAPPPTAATPSSQPVHATGPTATPGRGPWRTLSPAAFVLAIVCFFFPLISVSCGGTRVSQFTGVQLVTGTSIQEPQLFGPPKQHRVDPEPLMV